MRGRLSGPLQNGGEAPSGFGLKAASQERAFDLRDPYKLNRAPLLRGGKRGCASALLALAEVLSSTAMTQAVHAPAQGV